MTDHPDLDVLSAWLDGEEPGGQTPDVAAHVPVCPQCQSRLARLRAVREAVAGPVERPVAEEVDLAIARALVAADDWVVPAQAPPSPHAPEDTAWPPPGPAGRAGPAAPLESAGSAGRRGDRWRLWLAGSAAAAVAAVAVLAAVLLGSGTSKQGTDTALSAGPPESSAQAGAPAPAPALAGGAEEVVVQELGDVSDVASLADRAAAAREAPFSAASPPVPGPSTAATSDTAGPVPRAVGTRVCEVEARTARPQLGIVVFAANLRFRGTPAVALGFAGSPAGSPVTLLVLAPGEGCRVLAETTTP
jgi:hypothetical protein